MTLTGLTETQVHKNGLSNTVTAKAGLTHLQIVLRHTFTFLTLYSRF